MYTRFSCPYNCNIAVDMPQTSILNNKSNRCHDHLMTCTGVNNAGQLASDDVRVNTERLAIKQCLSSLHTTKNRYTRIPPHTPHVTNNVYVPCPEMEGWEYDPATGKYRVVGESFDGEGGDSDYEVDCSAMHNESTKLTSSTTESTPTTTQSTEPTKSTTTPAESTEPAPTPSMSMSANVSECTKPDTDTDQVATSTESVVYQSAQLSQTMTKAFKARIEMLDMKIAKHESYMREIDLEEEEWTNKKDALTKKRKRCDADMRKLRVELEELKNEVCVP